MAEAVWSQDIFSRGELSPLMYSRVTVDAYYNGLKTARNCITYPQGGIGKRFGTLFVAEVDGITDYKDVAFESFQYKAECTYILVFIADTILIYLEGILIHTQTSTGITAAMIPTMDFTVIEANFRMASSFFATPNAGPKDLVRSANSANTIASVASDELVLTTPVTSGLIFPATFDSTVGGTPTMPTTSPQILKNRTYFIRTTSTTTAAIYATATDAKAEINQFAISANGADAPVVITQNAWALNPVTFTKFPVFDFNDVDYSGVTFTPSHVSGFGRTITISSAIDTSKHVGGGFAGNGGICRINAVTSTTLTVDILQNFDNLEAIPGNLCFLAKPAWSDDKGWPSKCSSFQNRAVFANTRELPNGVWLSVVNGYNNFDGLEVDDDLSIFWYPSSDNVNVVNFIVPYRSLTVHTNTGIYSTPLTFEQAVTPTTFSMTLQDSASASVVQPRSLDNQIIVMSGNDVHSMLWDGFNNAYTSNIASIANEHLIRNPHDEAAYIDLNRAGSRYMFIINESGNMILYQTLISEGVAGFTPTDLNQTYGNAYFRWVTSSDNGRCWFLVEREIAEEGSGDLVDGFTENTLTLTTPNTFVSGMITAFKISTTTSMPTASAELIAGDYYWAVPTDSTNIKVYLTHADAVAEDGALTFEDAGDGCTITPWPLASKFYIEELSFDVFTDCTHIYSGAPEDTFASLERFNAQMVKAVGDGFGFEAEGNHDEVTLKAHGQAVEAADVAIGFPISTVVQTLPTAIPGALSFKGSSLTFPSHIRAANLMFNDTIGGFVNDVPIQMNTLEETVPGVPPVPTSGIMEITPMLGWDNESSIITITHDEPFDLKLIGIFYRIET